MRFTIRDILLLTVIAAVATGWSLDRFRMQRRLGGLESQLLRSRLDLIVARTSAFADGEQAALERHVELKATLAEWKEMEQHWEAWGREYEASREKDARRRARVQREFEESLGKLKLDKPPRQLVP